MPENTTKDVENRTLPIKTNGSWRIPLAAIIELHNKNLSQTEIAKLLGCHPSNISQRLKDVENTKHYVSHRAEILAHYQRLILESITATDLKKATLLAKFTSYGILYDKERIEKGLSTSNIAYIDVLKAKHQIQEEIRTLDAQFSVNNVQ